MFFFSLFRQLKEQSKKLVGVKRNQQLEREKQAQLLNEVKKQEDQKGETAEFFQVIGVSVRRGGRISYMPPERVWFSGLDS